MPGVCLSLPVIQSGVMCEYTSQSLTDTAVAITRGDGDAETGCNTRVDVYTVPATSGALLLIWKLLVLLILILPATCYTTQSSKVNTLQYNTTPEIHTIRLFYSLITSILH
jgi:hypothetical protein